MGWVEYVACVGGTRNGKHRHRCAILRKWTLQN